MINKRCLVVGGAACVYSDAERAIDLGEFGGVIAVKRIAERWNGPLCAFATLHADIAHLTLNKRRELGYPEPEHVVSSDGASRRNSAVTMRIADWSGSSGLLAVHAAIRLGFTRIVLCGVPMDDSPHFDRPTAWRFAPGYKKGWLNNQSKYAALTRSMSGWTRGLLGEPTKDWLEEAC